MNIHGLNVVVEVQGQGDCIVLLHGWGQNRHMMQAIAHHMQDRYQVLNLDLPGFGDSEVPKTAWSTQEYADFIYDVVQQFNGNNVILIAHSFGARIAFRYAMKYPTQFMVLTGAAGIRKPRNLSYYVKIYTYKTKKILHLNPGKGSRDYENCTATMRGVLVKAVNEDVRPLLSEIKTKTLLVFGELDEETPLWMGKVMEEEMIDATLVVLEQDDHFAYFHQSDRFLRIIDAYLKGCS